MATPKQEKLISLLLENLGKKGQSKTLGQMMLEAGYSENQAKNPYQILETQGVQDGVSDVVQKMERERNRILLELAAKDLEKERHKDLVDSMDKMTKNIQLLSGKETERAGVSINVVSYDPSNNTPQLPA